MISSDEEMVFRRAVADLDQLRGGAVVEFLSSGAVSGIREHVKIGQLARFLRPERLQRARGIGPAFGEEVAESQQIAWLQRVRLITHHGFEGRNRFEKFILPVVGEADIQPNSGDLRHQSLGFVQDRRAPCPLLAPHVDHAEIGVSRSRLRIDCKHCAEVALRFVEPSMLQSLLPALKQLSRIGLRRRRRPWTRVCARECAQSRGSQRTETKQNIA